MLYRLLRGFLRFLVRVVWRARITGIENVPLTGAVIIASNHLSFIDSVLLPIVLPRRVRFLAKADYFTGTGLRGRAQAAFFRAVDAMPVERDSQRDAMASLQIALGVLRQGWAFGIYPEGTRSRDGRLYDGRTGVGWLAMAAPAPVVPVALVGTDKVLPVGATWLRFHRIEVHFGPPVDPAQWIERGVGGARARREITDAVMDAIAQMSPQERARTVNER